MEYARGCFVLKKYTFADIINGKKKGILEAAMACLLLASFVFLSREAAVVSKEMNEQKMIVVDAGHGGRDPGMVGVGGLKEDGVNLAIAKKLKGQLEQNGYTVIMTREDENGLYEEGALNMKVQDLEKRISVIDESNALLTISIHQNSYEDASVKGPQVFYYEDSLEGERLARAIQERMNQELSPSSPREAKGNKTYYLLKNSSGVVNIVECGFLTNPDEAGLLQTEEYQERVAKAIVDGIQSYMGEK